MIRFALLFLIAMCASVGAVAASPITFVFIGTITQTSFDPVDPFLERAQPGSTIRGSYTFDSGATDSIASDQQGSFQTAGAPFGITIQIAAQTLQADDFLAINTLHSGIAEYGVLACSGSASCGGVLTFSLLLTDGSGAALSSDALPLTPPELGKFDSGVFSLIGTDQGNNIEIDGTIASLTPTPEPATMITLAVGLFGIGCIVTAEAYSRPRTSASLRTPKS